jgi:cytochrome c-type biogenesis protein CcmE
VTQSGNRRPLLSVLSSVIAISLTGWNATIMARVFWAPPIQWVSVGQLARNQVDYTQRLVRLEGFVVPGTLVRSATCVYGFRLESAGATISVHFAQCLAPHIFRHEPHVDLKLTAQGKLVTNWHFEAEQILLKDVGPYYLYKRPPEPDTFDDWSSYSDAGAARDSDVSPH